MKEGGVNEARKLLRHKEMFDAIYLGHLKSSLTGREVNCHV